MPRVPHLPGNRLNGFVHITANGGQHFAVKVHLAVMGKRGEEDVEVIPLAGWDEVRPPRKPIAEEPGEVIPIAPTNLDELLDPIPVDPDEQLSGGS